MLTLRIGPRSGKGLHRRDSELAAPVLPQSAGMPNTAEVCPRCQRDLTEYHFITEDGLPIITYHCVEHGDVIPMPSIIVREP